jgi:hypothetical protein
MGKKGLEKARELTIEGFHYDNLVKMAQACREETNPDRLLSAYILHCFFKELSDSLGDGIVMSSEIRELEVKYRTAVNLSLEKAINGEPLEERVKHLTQIIHLIWDV